MTELEERLRTAMAARAASAPAPHPLRTAERTPRPRSMWMFVSVAAAAAGVVAVALVASMLPHRHSATPPILGQQPHLPAALVATTQGDLALLDPASGELRVVSPGGGRRVVTIAGTGDGKTFYLGRARADRGCASTLSRVDVSAARVVETPVLRSTGLVNEIAVSPDRNTLAYVVTNQQSQGPKNRCDLAEMHMRDLRTGLDTRLVADASARPGAYQDAILVGSMSWRADGGRLVFIVQECCDGTASIRAVEPGRTLAPDYLHTPVLADVRALGCPPESVVQRDRDLLISAAGCGTGTQVFLISWDEQRHLATQLSVLKSGLSSMTYRAHVVVAEQSQSVITVDARGHLKRVAAGHEPGW
jgi:hypothetical protein